MLTYDHDLKQISRNLRSNMTMAEKKLWFRLRKKQVKNMPFTRQKIIGNYIVDFYCPQAKLIIELDGGQHYTAGGKAKDRDRDNYMKKQGLQVLRISDRDVMLNIGGVVTRIYQVLSKPP